MNEQIQNNSEQALINLLFDEGLQNALPRIAEILMNAAMLIERERHIGAAPHQRNGVLGGLEKVLLTASNRMKSKVLQLNAETRKISKGTILSSDPPYYDNIGYADLSDFFYVWLRKSLQTSFPRSMGSVKKDL